MIPRIIHYCWFGRGPMPDHALKCIKTWHEMMPDYDYMLWNENNFDVNSYSYTKEAYESGKYAFVSDVARLTALEKYGGLYFDVDFRVYKSFDDLLHFKAFAGFEGSKHNPVMMGMIASEPGGEWVKEMLNYYDDRHFILNGKMDLTTNVQFLSSLMQKNGFSPNGEEQDYKDLHIFPVEYFCPRLTTGEYKKNDNTYCEHCGAISSWKPMGIKGFLFSMIPPVFKIHIIKIKRKFLG